MKKDIEILSVPIPKKNDGYFFIGEGILRTKRINESTFSDKDFIGLLKLSGWSQKKQMCSLTHTLLLGKKVKVFCSFNPQTTDTDTNFKIDEVYAVVPQKIGLLYDGYLNGFLAESKSKKTENKNNQETISDPK